MGKNYSANQVSGWNTAWPPGLCSNPPSQPADAALLFHGKKSVSRLSEIYSSALLGNQPDKPELGEVVAEWFFITYYYGAYTGHTCFKYPEEFRLFILINTAIITPYIYFIALKGIRAASPLASNAG